MNGTMEYGRLFVWWRPFLVFGALMVNRCNKPPWIDRQSTGRGVVRVNRGLSVALGGCLA